MNTENGTFQDNAGRKLDARGYWKLRREARALDEQVAVEVMGWRLFSKKRGPGETWTHPDGYNCGNNFPPYSTDIAAAWLVVEKMRTDGFSFDLWIRDPEDRPLHGGNVWGAEFSLPQMLLPPMHWKGSAATAPLAICRAALLATAPAAERVSP